MNKFIQFLGIAKKSGNVCQGYNMTEEKIKFNKAKLVIISKQASQNTKDKFTTYCERAKIPMIMEQDKYELGSILGTDEMNIIGILDRGMATRLLELEKEITQ